MLKGAGSLLSIIPELPKRRVIVGSRSARRAFEADAQRAFGDLRKGAERVMRDST